MEIKELLLTAKQQLSEKKKNSCYETCEEGFEQLYEMFFEFINVYVKSYEDTISPYDILEKLELWIVLLPEKYRLSLESLKEEFIDSVSNDQKLEELLFSNISFDILIERLYLAKNRDLSELYSRFLASEKAKEERKMFLVFYLIESKTDYNVDFTYRNERVLMNTLKQKSFEIIEKDRNKIIDIIDDLTLGKDPTLLSLAISTLNILSLLLFPKHYTEYELDFLARLLLIYSLKSMGNNIEDRYYGDYGEELIMKSIDNIFLK